MFIHGNSFTQEAYDINIQMGSIQFINKLVAF
jgi:hypothetical protein